MEAIPGLRLVCEPDAASMSPYSAFPRSLPSLVFLLLALVLILVPGCRKKSFTVEVAHGFTGYVHIFCGPTAGFPSQPVRVNSLGGADAASCPGSDAEVTVLRDGKTVTVTVVTWERSGDGMPAALSFNVK